MNEKRDIQRVTTNQERTCGTSEASAKRLTYTDAVDKISTSHDRSLVLASDLPLSSRDRRIILHFWEVHRRGRTQGERTDSRSNAISLDYANDWTRFVPRTQ